VRSPQLNSCNEYLKCKSFFKILQHKHSAISDVSQMYVCMYVGVCVHMQHFQQDTGTDLQFPAINSLITFIQIQHKSVSLA
jgi:hypothetical protein